MVGEGSPAVISSKNKWKNHPSHPFCQPHHCPHVCRRAPTCPHFQDVFLEQHHYSFCLCSILKIT